MRICSFDGTRTGLVQGDAILDLTGVIPPREAHPALWLAAQGPSQVAALQERHTARVPLEAVRLDSPVRRPGKVVAAPVNYRAHGDPLPNRPRPPSP